MKPPIDYDDINTSYTQSITDKRINASKNLKKGPNRNKMYQEHRPSQSATNNKDNTSQVKANFNSKGSKNSNNKDNSNKNKNNNKNRNGNSNGNSIKDTQNGCINIIIGDSIIRNFAAWRLRKRIKKNERLYKNSFPGATISAMISYCIPSIDKKPNNTILH